MCRLTVPQTHTHTHGPHMCWKTRALNNTHINKESGCREWKRNNASNTPTCTITNTFRRDLSKKAWINTHNKQQVAVHGPLLLLHPHCIQCVCLICRAPGLKKKGKCNQKCEWTLFTPWAILPIIPLAISLLPINISFPECTHVNIMCQYREAVRKYWRPLARRLKRQ